LFISANSLAHKVVTRNRSKHFVKTRGTLSSPKHFVHIHTIFISSILAYNLRNLFEKCRSRKVAHYGSWHLIRNLIFVVYRPLISNYNVIKERHVTRMPRIVWAHNYPDKWRCAHSLVKCLCFNVTNRGTWGKSGMRVVPSNHEQPTRSKSLARNDLTLRVHLALHRTTCRFTWYRHCHVDVTCGFIIRSA